MGISNYIYVGCSVIIAWLVFDNYIKKKDIENLHYQLYIANDEKDKAINALKQVTTELNNMSVNRDKIAKELDTYQKESINKYSNIDNSLACEEKLKAYLDRALK